MRMGARRGWLAVPLAALAAASLSACGDLGQAELTRGVESLSANAAQGGLIAGGVADDATKATYAREMSKTLGEEAEHEAEKLADAEPEPEVAEERDAAVRIASQLADLYSILQVFPGDEEHGAAVQRRMNEVGEEADALAERLGGKGG
jgi:hypothetical protein